jgi:hypothetical protein
MPAPGSRSKQTILFMVPEDEDVFGTGLATALDGRALWMDSPGWGEHARPHRLLRDALHAGDQVQAFLRVTDDDGVPTGPILQYLASRVWRYENDLEFLREGRLAYRWFPGEEPDWLVERFNALIRLAWQHLVACTHPHVADMEDRRVRRARIGSHAKAWLEAEPNRWLGEWAPYGMYKLLPASRQS